MNNNYIPTRKKRTRYKFVKPSDINTIEETTQQIKFYYYICTFKNPDDGKYHMRKFVINGKNEFMSINDYKLSKSQCKKFFSIYKSHEYKCFSKFTLDDVNHPTLADIMTSKSDILANNYDYTGYAPFK